MLKREEIPRRYIDLSDMKSHFDQRARTESPALNRPKGDCVNHAFCYNYLVPLADSDSTNKTILTSSKPKGEYFFLPPSQDAKKFPMTVQTVVDWYCQSINRSYVSVANPKKSYQCSPLMQQAVKKVFNIKTKDLSDETKDEAYFKDLPQVGRFGLGAQERRRPEPEHRLLEPKEFKDGIPIEQFDELLLGEKQRPGFPRKSSVKKVAGVQQGRPAQVRLESAQLSDIEDLARRDQMNYSLSNRFSNYLRDRPGQDVQRISEGEARLAEAHLQSKLSAKKSIEAVHKSLEQRSRLRVPDSYASYMRRKADPRRGASRSLARSREEAPRSERVQTPAQSFALEDPDERRVTQKLASQWNDEKLEEANHYSKLLQKKLADKRIIIRDKKENQNKIFRDLLEDVAVKHFSGERATARKSSSQHKKNTSTVFINRTEYRKIEDSMKVELGLHRLKDQLLDDFAYLSHKDRHEEPGAAKPSSQVSKEFSKLLVNEAEPHARRKEAQSEAAKRLDEINEFMMEKAVLNFKGVSRDPANEGLSYNLELCRFLPEDYSNFLARRWFEKGVETCDQSDLLATINAFKQAVIQDSELFPAIYNLGCLYENVKDFELAFKWFYLAKTIEPEDKDVNFALALCYFKLKRYDNAIDLLVQHCLREDPPSASSTNSSVLNISSRAVQTYILSICYKGNMETAKAEQAYCRFLSMIEDSSNREIALYLFALLNKKHAGFSQRKMEEIKMGLLRSFKSTFPDEVESIGRYWDNSKKRWSENSLDSLVEALSGMHFFKRFPRKVMTDILKHCRFETLKKDSIIFYTEQTEKSVYIITKGTVIVKDHSSNIEVPRTAIQMQPGDVINPGDSDGGLLKSFHFWFRCSTEIEAIAMSRESFDNFWFAQTSFGLDTTCMVFKKMDLFANVSQATVFKVVYDLMEVRSFDQPTVLYDDLSYFDTYEEHRKREYEKKLKNPKNQLALDYLKRKSNGLNRLFEENAQVRQLLKSKSEAQQEGLFVVLEGQCCVYSDGGRKICDLPIGSTFGENLLARVKKTYSSFGIIVTGPRRTQVAFIPKSLFFRVPNYDIFQMHLSCLLRTTFDDIKLDID